MASLENIMLMEEDIEKSNNALKKEINIYSNLVPLEVCQS